MCIAQLRKLVQCVNIYLKHLNMYRNILQIVK